jgi:hypothetical protein
MRTYRAWNITTARLRPLLSLFHGRLSKLISQLHE